jgi:hypothetical protein
MFLRSRKIEPSCSESLACWPPVFVGGDSLSRSGSNRCLPTLLLNLPEWIIPELGDVLRNDLVHSISSNASQWLPFEDGVLMNVLRYCDGASLLNLTHAWGGSEIVPESQLRDPETGDVVEENLEAYRDKVYQAIVIDDSSMVHEGAMSDLVSRKFHHQNSSVVIMAVEGLFDLQPYRERFDLDWRFAAYTKRTIRLTDLGRRIITSDAFAPKTLNVKACFIEGGQRNGNTVGTSIAGGPGVRSSPPDNNWDSEALFMEHVDPRDYEDEWSDDESDTPRAPRPPSPGSPVVCSLQGDRSVSYFGFMNSWDLSYGAIVLRLCYAAQHARLPARNEI